MASKMPASWHCLPWSRTPLSAPGSAQPSRCGPDGPRLSRDLLRAAEIARIGADSPLAGNLNGGHRFIVIVEIGPPGYIGGALDHHITDSHQPPQRPERESPDKTTLLAFNT